MSSVSVPKLYRSVIEDVINGVRDLFLDDGVDEQVLIDLKQTWYKKVEETKALIDENNKDKGASTTGASSNSNSTTLSTTTTITPATRPVTAAQSQVTQVIASNQPRHITTGSSGLPTQTSITQVITTNQPRTLNAGGSSSYSQPAQISQVIPSNQPRTLTTIGTTLPQQTQITPVIATNQARHITTAGGSGLPQQLSFPSGSVIPHTVLQFPSGERIDGSKSVPSGKVIFLNTQASGLMSSSATTASLALPPELASSLLQQANNPNNSGGVINIQSMQPQELVVRHTSNPTSVINGPTTIQFQPASGDQRATRPPHPNSSGGTTNVVQLDGPNDNSSDDDDDDDEFRDNDDDHEDDDNDQNDDENEYTGEEEEPLNSEDDVSDEDPHELFDTDNVVVCQYDKITRSRNKWKFHLKDGIMNLQGKDYVFQKAIGDAEW
ncbi:transcription initiation factor IIA subunit 1-like isoform X2 [Panonychus citri]|uniref:transcription initiation factor IIA subunit 1-like isoform X2 n=1 Tax=Panonychus citri TaxID=50023 RepID=UPI0023080DD1|nr:transcription initiation factor IIA subunit 1-like isoform X2 [Panonychus citri]